MREMTWGKRPVSSRSKLIGALALVVVVCSAGDAWGEAPLNRITSVELEEEGERSTLTIVGSVPPEYTIASRRLPSRLIIELSNARAEGLASRVGSRTAQIAEVALGARYVEGALATRVLVYLRGTVAYQVEVEDRTLVMRFVSVADEDIPGDRRTTSPRRATAPEAEAAVGEQVESRRSPRETSTRRESHQSSGEETSTSGADAGSSSRARPREHVVQAGEVISRIAARYGVSVQDLLGWNPGIDPDRVRSGQRLVVRGPSDARHRVQPGEVLSAIAARHGVTVEDLIRWNPGLTADRIRVGATLVVQDPAHR